MTEKRFINDIDDGQLIDAKGELSTIDYSDKVDFYELWEFLNKLNDENEQLRHDATVLIQANQDYRRENDKIKSLLLNKIKDLNNDYKQSAKMGMPTGGIIGELDSFEEICEIMGWNND